jgi:hypothetical protein
MAAARNWETEATLSVIAQLQNSDALRLTPVPKNVTHMNVISLESKRKIQKNTFSFL